MTGNDNAFFETLAGILSKEARHALHALRDAGKDVRNTVEGLIILAEQRVDTAPDLEAATSQFVASAGTDEDRSVRTTKDGIVVAVLNRRTRVDRFYEVQSVDGRAQLFESAPDGRKAIFSYDFLTQEQAARCLIHALMDGQYDDLPQTLAKMGE